MADFLSKQQRAKVMAAVRSRENKATELRLIAIMRAHRITGWRRRFALRGNPDFVFLKARLAVFVDGCFWHGCPWHCRMPKSRTSFWGAKIAGNKTRDRLVSGWLRRRGWRTLRVWEHSLDATTRVAQRIEAALAHCQTGK